MVVMLKPSVPMLAPGKLGKLATTEQDRTRGNRWQSIRGQVLRRDSGLCVHCRRFGQTSPAREVDHIRPLWAGGTDVLRNLAAVCIDHHRAKSKAEASVRESGADWSGWTPEPLANRAAR